MKGLSYCTNTAGTTGCCTRDCLTVILQLVQEVALPRDCLTLAIQLVQQAGIPRNWLTVTIPLVNQAALTCYSISPHSYN